MSSAYLLPIVRPVRVLHQYFLFVSSLACSEFVSHVHARSLLESRRPVHVRLHHGQKRPFAFLQQHQAAPSKSFVDAAYQRGTLTVVDPPFHPGSKLDLSHIRLPFRTRGYGKHDRVRLRLLSRTDTVVGNCESDEVEWTMVEDQGV